MGSDKTLMQKIVDNLADEITLTYKSMFGEFGIYFENKFVAVLSDDQFSIKPTEAGRKFIKSPTEAPPYPGAKNYFFIENSALEDSQWIAELIQLTAEELPLPKPKKKK